MRLHEMKIGTSATIADVQGEKLLRHHLLDMGLVPGTKVSMIKRAPMGDPLEIRIRGYELTLRSDDAKYIYLNDDLKEITDSAEADIERFCTTKHPRMGEEEYYETKRRGRVIPPDETLTFALIGNQNSGKTTLFNQLTGSKQHVGNFPGSNC